MRVKFLPSLRQQQQETQTRPRGEGLLGYYQERDGKGKKRENRTDGPRWGREMGKVRNEKLPGLRGRTGGRRV